MARQRKQLKYDAVVMVGKDPETCYDAPLKGQPNGNPASGKVEVWGLNAAPANANENYDRWFQLHRRDELKEKWPGYERHVQWLRNECTIPVYTTEVWRDCPTSVRFPKGPVEELPRGKYHCGSFDWMVAYAIHLGFGYIFLYGVNFAEGGEPLSARACLEYWLGVAEGRGIQTCVWGGDLFHYTHLVKTTKQYGYDWTDLLEDGTEPPHR